MPEAVEKNATEVPTESTVADAAAAVIAPTATAENGASGDHSEQNAEVVAPPKEMRAIVLTAFGNLKNVKLLKKPEPVLGNGEVLIRVKAWYVFFFVYKVGIS